MKNFFLKKVRLSTYLLFFLGSYTIVAICVDKVPLDRAALTLFSANSFLYGFYISPIVKSQNDRIERLQQLVSKEATKIYEVALYSKRLTADAHRETLRLLKRYTKSVSRHEDYTQGEREYKKFMSYLIDYDGDGIGKDQYKEMMKASFAIQQNRVEIDLTLKNKVYKNEWIVMLILFSITITFISIIEIPDILFLKLIPPVLSSGLTMLIVILLKKSTMTHKKAKDTWKPMELLADSNFYQLIQDPSQHYVGDSKK
jgi:hypothetical protein